MGQKKQRERSKWEACSSSGPGQSHRAWALGDDTQRERAFPCSCEGSGALGVLRTGAMPINGCWDGEGGGDREEHLGSRGPKSSSLGGGHYW